MPNLTVQLGDGQWGSNLNQMRVDARGGLTVALPQAATTTDEGYEIISSGSVRFTPVYDTAQPERDRALPELAPGERVRVAARVVTTSDLTSLPGGGVLEARTYLLRELRPIADMDVTRVRLRVTSESDALVLTTDPDDIEWREELLGSLPLELYTPPPEGSGLAQIDRVWVNDRAAAGVSVPFDRATGVRLVRATWLGSELHAWCPEDWTLGPVAERQTFKVENRSGFAVGLGALRLRDSAAGREYRVLLGAYLAATDLPPVTGTWTSGLIPLPAHGLSMRLHAYDGEVYDRDFGGNLVWQKTPYWRVEVGGWVKIFDAAGTLLVERPAFNNIDVPIGATHYQASFSVRTNLIVSIRSLTMFFVVDAVEFGRMPETRSGTPARGNWRVPALGLRVRPSQARMPKHPLMASGAQVRCWALQHDMGDAIWESATHLRVPEGTVAAYFDPGATPVPVTPKTVAQIEAAEAALGQGTWGAVERPLESFQLYVPTLKVRLCTLSGQRYDLTHEVADFAPGRLSVVGDARPQVDAAVTEAGAGLEIEIDGYPVQYAKVVACTRSHAPNGRKLEIAWADPLDFHNFDMETLNETGQPGLPPIIPPPPLSEMAYLDAVAEKSGLGGVTKDARLFTRSTGYWTAGPGVYGYGGITADLETAYSGQGGTVTQEIELVANANLGTAVAAPGAAKQVLIAPLMPRPRDTLDQVLEALLSGETNDGYVYNVAGGKYLPDTRLTIGAAGFDQSKGYSLVNLEGNSNVFTSTPDLNPATIFNQSNDGLTTAIYWRYYGGSTVPGVNDAWSPFLDWRYFAAQRNQAVMKGWYPVTMNGVPQDLVDSLFVNWRDDPVNVDSQQMGAAGMPSANGTWLITLPQLRSFGQAQTPEVRFTPPDGSYNRVISGAALSFAASAGTCYIDRIEFLVESPARLRKTAPESTLDLENYGPVITAVRAHVNNVNSQEHTLEFLANVDMWGLSAEGIKLKPYSEGPDAAYAPAWYAGFVQEAIDASKKRLQKKNTVQNPFVVEILPGRFPDQSEPLSFDYPVPETVPDKLGPNYQSGRHVSTALNLWEWLRSRATTFEYVGAPSWRPGQFMAVARRPDDGPGHPPGQYDLYLILEPAQVNVQVGQDIATTVTAGFIGTVKRGVPSWPSPLAANPFKEDL